MDIERIVVRLVADATNYLRSMNLAENALIRFVSQARLIESLVDATSSVASEAVKLATEYERAAIALEVMTGSAEVAKNLLTDINRLALESPFHTRELVVFAKELMAFGTEVEAIVPTLAALGDVAAGTGGRMDRIVLAFGQVRTAGRLMGQELRQFTNAGIPILEYLSKVMGKTTSEIRQMVHRGQISFSDVAKAFNAMTQEGGRFAGMMDRINKDTVAGRWENFVENLQMAARDFGLAALEGLGFKDILTSLSTIIGGGQGVNKEGIKDFFKTVRGIGELGVTGVSKLLAQLQQLWEWLNKVYIKTIDWLTVNKDMARIIFTVVGLMVAWYVAVRTLTLLFVTLTAVLRIVNTVLLVFRTLLTVSALISSLGSLVAMLVSLGATLLPLLAIVAALAAIVVILDKLDAFVGIGSTLAEGWGKFKNAALEAWEGIKAAFKSGDMEAVFDIIFKTLRYGWVLLVASMEAELERLLFNLSYHVAPAIQEIWINIQFGIRRRIAKLADDLGLPQKFGTQEDIERARRSEVEGDRLMAQLRMQRDQPELERRMAEIMRGRGDRELEQLRESVFRARFNAEIPSGTGRNIAEYLKNVEESGGPFGMLRAMMFPPVQPPISGFAAVGGVPGLEAAAETQRRLWGQAAEDIGRVMELARQGKFGTPEMEEAALQARKSTEALDKFSNAIGGVGEEIKKAIPIPFDISPQARDEMQQLLKTLEDGIGPMDKFRVHVERLNEAFRGRPEAMPLLAAGGGPAMVLGPGMGGNLTPEQHRMGLFLRYEELRKSLNLSREGGAPAQLFGSREAQDTINRAKFEQRSELQEVIMTLQIGQRIAEQQRDYAEKTSLILERMEKEGSLVIPRPGP